MIDDTREPIIDSLLEELLGGQQPPDLKQRILAAHAKQTNGEDASNRAQDESRTAPHTNDRSATPRPVVAPKHETITIAPQVVPRAARNHRRTNWRVPVIVALVLISASIVSVWALRDSRGPIVTDVRTVDDTVENTSPQDDPRIPPGPSHAMEPIENEGGTALLADTNNRPGSEDATPVPTDERIPDTNRERPANFPELQIVSADEEIVDFIDEQLEVRWTDLGIDKTRTSVSDVAWCRRVYQHLFGRLPKAAEVRRFINERDRQKRSKLLETLFAREETISEFANHWAGVLATMLIGDKPRKNVDRAELERFLRASLFVDKPYDQLVSELLTAVGSNTSGRDDFDGAANFLLAFQDKKKTAATDQACRVFLGRRIQCARCHDHPLNEWRQEQYWQFASFFMQMQASSLENNGGMQLVNRDYPGESDTPQEAEVFYVEPGELNRVAYPVYLDGTEASSRSGLIDDIDRRQELASMLVKSDEMSQAFVNRVWDQLFGSGFTHPVDDMGPHNPPSHPLLLSRLASEFKDHNYSLRNLTRWMVLSKAFDRQAAKESVATGQFITFQERTTPQPRLGNLLKRLADARRNGRQFDPIAQFQDNGKNTAPDGSATARVNGKLKYPILDTSAGSLLFRIDNSKLSEDDMIQHLFMATVGRRTSKSELVNARSILQARSRLDALQDIGATLLISSEFVNEH